MADLISRQAALEILGNSHKAHARNSREEVLLDRDIRLLKEIPAVDAVEVVRCKDCKKNPRFSKTSGKHMVWCRKWRCEVKDTDFCSYGERREENAAD